MTIRYDQLYSPGNIVSGSPYIRLPSYRSLRPGRYHPYSTARVRLLSSSTDMMELVENDDSETDILLPRLNPIPIPFSLPTILQDDCLASLRTVVSQMRGRDSGQMGLGFTHLIIDFALIVRSHLRKSGVAIRNKTAMTLPPAIIGLSM